jgi:hypothetical protein
VNAISICQSKILATFSKECYLPFYHITFLYVTVVTTGESVLSLQHLLLQKPLYQFLLTAHFTNGCVAPRWGSAYLKQLRNQLATYEDGCSWDLAPRNLVDVDRSPTFRRSLLPPPSRWQTLIASGIYQSSSICNEFFRTLKQVNCQVRSHHIFLCTRRPFKFGIG